MNRRVHCEKTGLSSTPEYRVWTHIKERCFNPTHPQYKHYGGRGITMAAEFTNSFAAFYREVGPRPGKDYSIDRIDNNRGYVPGNLRWATRRQQCRNRRSNRSITYQNLTLTLKEWSEKTGFPYHTLFTRLERGWPVEKVLSFPLRVWRRPSSSTNRKIGGSRAAPAHRAGEV